MLVNKMKVAFAAGLLSTVVAGVSMSGGLANAATTNWSKVHSAAAGGGMSALVKAAKKEGSINVITIPLAGWANYGLIMKDFTKKYGIKINDENPNGSSQDEITAVMNDKGRASAPDVLDVGTSYAVQNTNLLAPYKVQTWSEIPAGTKANNGAWFDDYGGYVSIGCDTAKIKVCPTSFADLAKPMYKNEVGINGDPTQASALRTKLLRAGYSNREAVAYYLGVRSILLLIATVVVILVMPMALSHTNITAVLGVAVIVTGIAVFGPDQVLRSRQTKREREYREGFPDLLDLMVASVEAGLSLDAAVSRITEELVSRYPNLSENLYLMTLEFRAGQARKDAWARFADRLGIDEARSFSTMLRQAEEMGSSMAETLSVFADDMRQKRMLRAEEKALALPAKMMIPLILFIFPCLIGVLMLPAGVKISHAFGGGH